MLPRENPPRATGGRVDGARIVDYFAGAGGWSIAAKGLGCKVLYAVNHWDKACETHRLNFPAPATTTVHQDAFLIDPTTLPAHDVFIASPSCTGFTKARGKDRPHHDTARCTPWCVGYVAEIARPPLVIVENVPDFGNARKWPSYPAWRMQLEVLGYQLAEVVLNASEFGVPQERERLFVVAALNKTPITPRSPGFRPVPASTIITDLNSATWNLVDREGRSPAVLEAMQTFHGRLGNLFAFNYHGSAGARTLDRPLGTIAGADNWAVVKWPRMRMLKIAEYKAAMGFSEDYVLCGGREDQTAQIGNAVVVPVAGEVIAQALGASPGWAARRLGFGG